MPRDDADDEIRFSPFGRDPRHTQLNPEDVEFLDEEVTREQALSMIGKVWAGNAGDELFRLFDAGNYKATLDVAKAKVAEQERLVAEAEEGYDVDKLVPRKLPHIGMVVCDCRYKHLKIAAIDENGDDIILEDGRTCSYTHCTDNVPHVWAHPCPVCHEGGGFHNDDMHRKNIDPKYLLEKGWHQK